MQQHRARAVASISAHPALVEHRRKSADLVMTALRHRTLATFVADIFILATSRLSRDPAFDFGFLPPGRAV